MVISHSQRYIFVHIAKCGGTTVTDLMVPNLAKGDIIIDGRNPQFVGRPIETLLSRGRWKLPLVKGLRKRHKIGELTKHAFAKDIAAAVGDSIWNEYYTFSFIRNPWDRCVSAYFWIRKNRGIGLGVPAVRTLFHNVNMYHSSFDQFVRSDEFRALTKQRYLAPMVDFLTDENGELMVDYVGRLEDFAAEIARIPPLSGASANLCSNTSKRKKDFWSYYDDETKEIVAEIYKADIEMFGYTPDKTETLSGD